MTLRQSAFHLEIWIVTVIVVVQIVVMTVIEAGRVVAMVAVTGVKIPGALRHAGSAVAVVIAQTGGAREAEALITSVVAVQVESGTN